MVISATGLLNQNAISTFVGQVNEVNDNLGMCVRLSISTSTHDALFRSQHLEDQLCVLSNARVFSILWKALLLNFSSLLRRQQSNGLAPQFSKEGIHKANRTFGAQIRQQVDDLNSNSNSN